MMADFSVTVKSLLDSVGAIGTEMKNKFVDVDAQNRAFQVGMSDTVDLATQLTNQFGYTADESIALAHNLAEIKKIIVKVLEKTDLVLVSRIQKKDFEKIIEYCKKNKLKIKKFIILQKI